MTIEMRTRPGAQAVQALTAEHIVVARVMLDTADVCMLISQGEAGGTSARLRQHVKPEADLRLCFGTSADARRVHAFWSTPRATVTCLNQRRSAYAALNGVVTVEVRARQSWRYWRDAWQTCWPEGPRALSISACGVPASWLRC